ncbi:MAG: hypothetical protein LUD27_04870 [Clostridia bacterium]|nr:hypothetical protein [Clostridia bacterium]
MFDIYSFINSKDVAEYLRGTGYKFAPDELAYIVWHSDSRTLEERIAAWREIADTYPDFEIEKRCELKNRKTTLKEYLLEYIAMVEDLRDRLLNNDGVYTFRSWRKNGYYDDNDRIFTSFNGCVFGMQEHSFMGENVIVAEITKQKLLKEGCNGYFPEMIAHVNGKGKILDVMVEFADQEHIKEIDLRLVFENMWFALPVPFKKGDIVVSRRHPIGEEYTKQVFVFLDAACQGDKKRIKYLKKKGDDTDMIANGYFLSDDGILYGECIHYYPDLEFYRGTFEGKDKILWAVSNYLQGKIDLSLLLNSYYINLNGAMGEKAQKQLNFTDDDKNLAGIYGQCSVVFPKADNDELTVWAKQFGNPNGAMAIRILESHVNCGLFEKGVEDGMRSERFYEELNVIEKLGITEVFLVATEIVDRVKTVCYPFVGGAWNSSYVAYGTGITDLDPTETGTPYQRLFNKYKKSLPKLQITVPRGYGEKVMQAIDEKYAFFADITEEDLPYIPTEYVKERLKDMWEGWNGIYEPYCTNRDIIAAAADKYFASHKDSYNGGKVSPNGINQFADFIAYDKWRRDAKIQPEFMYYEQIVKILSEEYSFSLEEADEAVCRLIQNKDDSGDIKEYFMYIADRKGYDEYKSKYVFQEIKRSVCFMQLRAAAVSYAQYLYLCEEKNRSKKNV